MIPVQHGRPADVSADGIVLRARLNRARSGAEFWIGDAPSPWKWMVCRDEEVNCGDYQLRLGPDVPGALYLPLETWAVKLPGWDREQVVLLGQEGLGAVMVAMDRQGSLLLYAATKMPEKRRRTCLPLAPPQRLGK